MPSAYYTTLSISTKIMTSIFNKNYFSFLSAMRDRNPMVNIRVDIKSVPKPSFYKYLDSAPGSFKPA